MSGRKFSLAYRYYAVAMMTAVYTVNLIDRGLMTLLLQPIKEDLLLSDTQLGFLTGIAFGLFYATLGIPIARWSDRGNRVNITALAIGLWSVTVMVCVLVTSYLQLVVARIAAAVGESGCKPPTYSLAGDYFPAAAERTRAMSIYWLANPLASFISFVIGGSLNELYGWRTTFLLMGIPGLLLAVLVKLTIVEPRAHFNGHIEHIPLPPMRGVLAILWQQRSCRHLITALVFLYTMGFGLGPWYAAFMIRNHGMQTSELGLWLGIIYGAGGLAGTLLGGYVSARWFSDNEHGQMRLSAVTVALLVPSFIALLMVPYKSLALLTLVPLTLVFSFFIAPTYALLQRLVRDEMRATTLAVVMLLANLIGMGVGPQVVGILSDVLRSSAGANSLRYAMLIVSLIALLAAHQFWRTAGTVKEDLRAVAGAPRPPAEDEPAGFHSGTIKPAR